jgi:two-component sensor histidine kinase
MDPASLSLDFLSEPALAMDAAGTVLVANPQARGRLGADIRGRSIYGLLAEPADRLRGLLRRAAASTAPIVGAVSVAEGARTSRHQVRAARLSHDPAAAGMVVLMFAEADEARFRALRDTVNHLQALLRERMAEQARLSQALAHNQLLYRELQHRAKNNIHLIGILMRMSAREFDTPEVRAVVDAGLNRIQAMARTQEAIYEALDSGSLRAGPFLDRILRGLFAADPGGARLELSVADVALAGERAHNLALIVNELVTNALKYGRRDAEARVRVALDPDGDGYALSVADNGPGFDADSAPRNSGLAMVEALALQLDGTLEFGAAPAGGACVRLHLPAAVCAPGEQDLGDLDPGTRHGTGSPLAG